MPETPQPVRASGGLLDRIERIGNLLPEPALLFVLLAALVTLVSAAGVWAGWRVQPVRPQVVIAEVRSADGQMTKEIQRRADGHPQITLVPDGPEVAPRSLLTSDGLYWMLSSMLRNFTGLPALGLIFVAILGIGLAEKFGFFSALMRFLAMLTPRRWLTPVIVLIGANASVASDAGYIILPPLAAALFHAVGRPPLAGLAAAFAGVAGGFGAGFFPNGGDGALTGFAQDAAHVIDPEYTVNILHNLYFKAGSALVIMLAGWFVTDRIVEPRLRRAAATNGDGDSGGVIAQMALSAAERRALLAAVTAGVAVLAGFAVIIATPGLPLHGPGQPTLADGRALVHLPVKVAEPGTPNAVETTPPLAREPLQVTPAPGRARLVEPPAQRWTHVIVPMIFLSFLVPGLVYGRLTGALTTQRDFVEGLHHGIRSIVPVLVIAFFMAQFVNYFAYTRLDRMLAYAGGSLLVQADLPVELLLVLFVLVVILGDFALSGMLSKFGVLAPIFIPMFMMVGMSPELTTAAYRVGDSVVNTITPLNSYVLVILAVLQKYRPGGGLGTLLALMLPYAALFATAWTLFLLGWYWVGADLGPASPLDYLPPA